VRHQDTYESYALTNPRTVMIKTFHTVVTDRAVRASRWSIQHAGVAVLDLHDDSIYMNILCSWQAQLLGSLTISSVIVQITGFRFRRMVVTRHYTRISTRGKKQQSQILESIRNEVQTSVNKRKCKFIRTEVKTNASVLSF
jgi:hypothetical protein